MSELGVGIMAVRERSSMVRSLIDKLELTPKVISWDDGHHGHVINWWKAVDLALISNPKHVLIIEDDALVCQDFIASVTKLIKLYPDRTISFFSRKKDILSASAGSLVQVTDVPTDLAVVYPKLWLDQLRVVYLAKKDSFARNKRRWGFGADEMRMELMPDKVVWTTVPSLVQHRGALRSSLGHYYPANLSKRFIGENVSGLTINWKANC